MMYLILSLILNQAIASDEWLCHGDNVSSVRRGNSIYACGTGEGHEEYDAQKDAFLAAKLEFTQTCKISEDCRNKKITVEAKRTECEPLAPDPLGGAGSAYWKFKCYRLVVFTMED